MPVIPFLSAEEEEKTVGTEDIPGVSIPVGQGQRHRGSTALLSCS